MKTTWSAEQKLASLITLIEGQGFEVIESEEGYIVGRDGSWTCYYLKPNDPRKLMKAAINALPKESR